MSKKVLIVDDSALMRRLLSDIIKSDNRYEEVDIAHDGLEAYDIITLNPKKYDVILLDLNMPKMSGIQLMEHLHKLKLNPKIIIVSTLAKEGAKETIRCLELGAFDFVTKPENLIEIRSDRFKNRILTLLETTLSLKTRVLPVEPTATKDELKMNLSHQNKSPVSQVVKRAHISVDARGSKLIALACSTGGPKALHQVIPLLKSSLDAPMIIVQHMPEGFTKSLADRLNEISSVCVKEAEDGEVLKKGCVYIAKGGYQLRVLKKANGTHCLSLTKEAARYGLKPCADILYESLAEAEFKDILCVVLTGMGQDGTAGIQKLNEKNNIYVLAQDKKSCTVYGMPKAIYESGLVDEVITLDHMAEAIMKNVGC